MDNVTHTLFALTLARTSLGLGRGATAALVLASNAPDIDFVAAAAGAGRYLQWHRGPTHGPIGIIALGLVTAGLVWAPRRATPYARLAMVAILGVLLHVLMDLPTSYGTRILSPFDWHWFAEDWMPIIDVYLLIVLAVGLWIGARGGAARRVSVAIVLALMASDYLFRGIAHRQALAAAPRLFSTPLPAPCADAGPPVSSWPRDRRDAGGGSCLIDLAAIPGLTSPFAWRLIAQSTSGYETRDVNLLDIWLDRPPGGASGATHHQNLWTPLVFEAAATNTAQLFLGFSRFPAVQLAAESDGGTTVRWTDLRFAGRPSLFTATVRFDRQGRIVQHGFGP